MENSAAIQASLAGRYASALFDLAAEQGIVTSVESDLARVEQGLGESAELAAIIRHPRISRQMQASAIDGVAGVLGLSQLTRNFMGVLAKNRRLGDLSDIIRAFRAIAAAQRGEMAAEVTSAHALSDAQIAELKDRLTARDGRTVTLSTKVDPELLGGLVVTIGSKRIDGSIRTRLNSLAHAMKG